MLPGGEIRFGALSNLFQFMSNPITFMTRLASRGRDIERLKLGPKNFVFIFNPDAAQDILVRKASIYVQNRNVFDRIQPVTGKRGLVQLSGTESQNGRLKSRAMFTSSNLEQARTIISSFTDELIEQLGPHQTLDVTQAMTDLILRTALKIFLGVDSQKMVDIIGAKFLRLNHLCGLRMRSYFPLPLSIPTPRNREIQILRDEIRNCIAKHLQGMSSDAMNVPHAFRNDPAVIDHCMTFLFAGHETTASSLAFTFLLLARYPQYQEAIANNDEQMTLAIYKESLRLYPPAYMLARQANADDELSGVRLRKSDQVIIAVEALHRSAKYYDHPDEFRPERFLGKLKHPFSFIPFGSGAKSCVGERLAYLEAGVILTKFCQRYRLIGDLASIATEPLITLHPQSGQRIRLEPRGNA